MAARPGVFMTVHYDPAYNRAVVSLKGSKPRLLQCAAMDAEDARTVAAQLIQAAEMVEQATPPATIELKPAVIR